MKSLRLTAIFDDRVTNGDRVRLAIPVHGVDRPVWCLSFAEETRLLNDRLQHFIDNLNPLTIQLHQGPVFEIPRTILFNFPDNSKERIYGLLMQSLLTLHKARQFISLLSEGEHDHQLQEEQQRLHALAENLQTKLNRHIFRSDFECRVSNWLSKAPQENNYQIKKKELITSLLMRCILNLIGQTQIIKYVITGN